MENTSAPTTLYPNTLQINALIVDDERGAINTLCNMLGAYCPQVQVVRTAMSVKEAVLAAKAIQPELVFLDIEMPPLGSGFDFLNQSGDFTFGVIFITAYPQHAIRAINAVQPWAYLVKPFSVSELIAAVDTAGEKIRQQRQSTLQAAGQQKLILHDNRKGTIVLLAGEIALCQADGSCTDIMVWKNQKFEKFIASRNLGEFEAELPASLFCRTHHSFIVNLAYIERVERTGRNGLIYLRHLGEKASVSVSRMEYFIQRLEQF